MNTFKLLLAILLGTTAGVLMGLIISPFHKPTYRKRNNPKKRGWFNKT